MTTTLHPAPKSTTPAPAVPEADPILKPAVVSDEDRFLFDLQGYIILRGALSDKDRLQMLAEVNRLEELTFDDSHWHIKNADGRIGQDTKQVSPGFCRLNGLYRMSTAFDRLLDYPTVYPYLVEFMGDPQNVNTWSISKSASHDSGGWHRGVEPDHYSVRKGLIRNRMLNVVHFLTPNTLDNGCMVALPGGHKSNFDLPWSKYKGLDLPGSVPILGNPGDVLLFSESLLHNGLGSTSTQKRTNIYFNYGSKDFNVMTYSPEHNYHFAMPPHVRARFTPTRRKATSWMDHVITID